MVLYSGNANSLAAAPSKSELDLARRPHHCSGGKAPTRFAQVVLPTTTLPSLSRVIASNVSQAIVKAVRTVVGLVKSTHVQSPSIGISISSTSKLDGPHPVGDGLAGEQPGECVIDRVREAVVAAETRGLIAVNLASARAMVVVTGPVEEPGAVTPKHIRTVDVSTRERLSGRPQWKCNFIWAGCKQRFSSTTTVTRSRSATARAMRIRMRFSRLWKERSYPQQSMVKPSKSPKQS
jgi:hypothetical protein